MDEWEWNLLENKQPLDRVITENGAIRVGDRVRLKPRAGGDVLDLALAGKTAVVEAIEQDYEGRHHLAVVLDEDPGRDLGVQRQPGHQFFFAPNEVERLPTILVAGVGNIFLGDDGFGVEVVRRLTSRALPASVTVLDFGIRGFDLACALVDGHDVSILVDACPGGKAPGTLSVLEPDLAEIERGAAKGAGLEPHGLDPLNVLRLAKRMGPVNRVLVVGCEPEWLGGDEGHVGLSSAVASAAEQAVALIEGLVDELLREAGRDG